jgi:uncharacterized protein YecE (DUF72 family)
VNSEQGPLIGCCGFGSDIGNYLRRFNAVEYQQSFFSPPRQAVLGRLRERVPRGFAFIVRAWQLVTHEASSPGYRRLQHPLRDDPAQYGHFRASEGVREALGRTMEVARQLEAPAILFETPASFSPTAENRRRMSRFFEDVPRDRGEDEPMRLIWEPRGIWSDEEIRALCHDLDLLPCSDPFAAQDEPPSLPDGAAVYIKLRGLGTTQHYSDAQLEWLVERLGASPGACCVFGTVNMFQDASRLVALLAPDEEP